MNSPPAKLSARPRRLLRSASLLLALLFVMLRPACEVLAASGEQHAPTISDHAATQVAGSHTNGHTDDGICCDSVDAQALTVPASAPLPTASLDVPVALASALLQPPIPLAPLAQIGARRDPAPPRSYHARSLRRLD